MKIGVPKEIKSHEYRVGATPAMVRTLVAAGHEVWIEKGAAEPIGFTDEMYRQEGAKILESAEEVWKAEMVLKVKEPLPPEYPFLREDLLLFCYLHLAPDPQQTKALVESGVTAIAYETVTDAKGRLPLLIPMSEIAGRIAIQEGAVSLQMHNHGKGLLLGGVPGVNPAKVAVIGGGIVGTEAARMAMGLGAKVTILDKSLERLRELDHLYGPKIRTLYSTSLDLEEAVAEADLVIGAVLIPGKSAPKLVTRDLLRKMTPGSVLVDVAIDQGGCAETSRPTTHGEPRYIEEGVVHYCVANMPGACSRTATKALTNATFDYVLKIANLGYHEAMRRDPGLKEGLNVCKGKVTNEHVAHDLGYDYVPPEACCC